MIRSAAAGGASAARVGTAAVTSIFTKLDLTPDDREHRRVLAVLTFLRA